MKKSEDNFLFLSYYWFHFVAMIALLIPIGINSFDAKYLSSDILRGIRVMSLVDSFTLIVGFKIAFFLVLFHFYEMGLWSRSDDEGRTFKIRIRVLAYKKHFTVLYKRLKKRLYLKVIYFLSFCMIEYILLYFIKQYNLQNYHEKVLYYFTTTMGVLTVAATLILIDIIIEFLVLRKAYRKYNL